MGIDKKWEIHNLNSVNLRGDDDVTRSMDTFLNLFIIIWATTLISPLKNIGLLYPILFTLSFIILLAFSRHILKKSFVEELWQINLFAIVSLILLGFFVFGLIDTVGLCYGLKKPVIEFIKVIILTIFALYSLWNLLFNRNFILYDLLYRFRLKIKLITIEENLSPFAPLIDEFERIILGLNRNSVSGKEEKFDDSIIFFWIRKDKEKSRERSINQFIPYLSLITVLFVLKEKSYKFVAIIGAYFSFVGILFIVYYTYLIEKLEHLDYLQSVDILQSSATISVSTIILLIFWYLITIYNIYNLIDISKYLKRVNKTARRAKIKKEFNFSKGYSNILETFDRDNALYIYDYTFDKYQQVDSNFLSKNLNSSKRLVDKNIAALITIIISMVLVVFVEITANGIFQTIVQNKNSTNKAGNTTKDKGYKRWEIKQ